MVGLVEQVCVNRARTLLPRKKK